MTEDANDDVMNSSAGSTPPWPTRPAATTTGWAARTTTPSTARSATRSRQSSPTSSNTARADRAFLGRAVRYLAGEAGIRQFLDIGTGLPTADNTHEVAQARRARRRASSTSTTTRSCWRTPAPC